ncbi:hypothetical protein [Pseudobacteroides cellulosolvens]|uniref:Uncharacterized protein n=1 Tax=Pseudobacteroides cellulosolvens ATCC 35603 = DSM 2933 TaxID=398512 RepID=A0A0L6JJ02_9FIRM|nr:hypothetical protein [Pseudobacteroides cellulosolvens]KNY25695.1 hypothetical protein Bccel_0955 [Pseudobacteroides cellulosolvens ATCC 35603 = DSM 2933]KNY25710.1 hypothetical protein Bccel_0970 [Pseudobacteroides cellulosolvens ATCC 35603 = DSM 2933]
MNIEFNGKSIANYKLEVSQIELWEIKNAIKRKLKKEREFIDEMYTENQDEEFEKSNRTLILMLESIEKII